jgi:hypothetical protein
MLGSWLVSWSYKKQPIDTLPTTEAEFVAGTSCSCQAIWLRKILEQLGRSQKKGTIILCVNSSSIKMLKNPMMQTHRYKISLSQITCNRSL